MKIKNKVYNNTKSYINNWNTLALYTFLILNQFLMFTFKNWKKVLQFVMWNDFPLLSYVFFYIFASFTPTKQPYFEISEMTTHTPCARDYWWTLDFANAFLSPGGISTIAPGLRPERRSAPLARGLIDSLKTAVWAQSTACEINILNQSVTKKGIFFNLLKNIFYTFSALIQYIFATSVNCLAVETGNVKAGVKRNSWPLRNTWPWRVRSVTGQNFRACRREIYDAC